jgi:hypothetical protein
MAAMKPPARRIAIASAPASLVTLGTGRSPRRVAAEGDGAERGDDSSAAGGLSGRAVVATVTPSKPGKDPDRQPTCHARRAAAATVSSGQVYVARCACG